MKIAYELSVKIIEEEDEKVDIAAIASEVAVAIKEVMKRKQEQKSGPTTELKVGW